jgi:hypothetical protein
MAAPRNGQIRTSRRAGLVPSAGSAPRACRSPSRSSRTFAKLTRPRLHAALPRERLFRVLDEASAFPVVWIAAPPGAGKTTLAATWLEARKRAGMWYQLDSGDSDPATFFYYLKAGAEAAGVARDAALPLLTADHQHDVPAFARRWFRELFSRLPEGAVLALDNYQEVAEDSMLHRIVAAACDELPAGAQLLVMSWVEPPAELAPLLAHERILRLDAGALRLTAGEAAGIAEGRDALTKEEVHELHERCGGWAAGFTLLRERTQRTGHVNQVDQRATMQEVFDYFVTLVFRDLPADQRAVLIETAVLPRFTEPMAIELSGDPAAAETLGSLYRRHLFVERRYGAEVTYQYHVLFRTFLLDRLRRSYTRERLTELSQRAAALLERCEAHEAALQLHLDARDHHRAGALLAKLAPELVAAGRGASLREWLAKLPEPIVEEQPLLSYWLGTSLMGVSTPGARAAYERAHAGFVRDGDRTGQAMAVAGLLHTFLHGRDDDLFPVQRWLATVGPLFADAPAFATRGLAARVYGTLVGIMLWMAPAHPMFPVCVRRLEAVLNDALDDDVRVTAAGYLAEYYATAGFVRDADRVIAAGEPATRSAFVSPMAKTYWLLRTCRRDWAVGEFGAVRAKLERALEISVQSHRGPGGYVAMCLLVDLALDTGDLDAVPALLERAPSHVPSYVAPSSSRNAATAVLCFARGKYAACRGDLEAAVRQLEQARSLTPTSWTYVRFIFSLGLASALVESGDAERARVVLEELAAIHPAERFPCQAFRHASMLAVLAARRGDTAPLGPAREGLRSLQELGVTIPFTNQPIAARQVAELLLRERVEVPYVRAWIRRANLRPSSPDVPNWPWPIRVRTLGAFGIELDDVPLRFQKKAPRKPLELLQAIVAFGGREVRVETLCDALWPDSDGDAAEAALRMTLSRLRKLLNRDAVVQHQGRVSLDASSCWVDVWSFRDACAVLESRTRDPRALLSDLYRGAFLEREREQPWILAARDSLRAQFDRAMSSLGAFPRRTR